MTIRAGDVRGRGGERGEAAANRVIPPRPKEMGQRPQRGDIDIVIISQKYGVVLVEVGALADGVLVIRTCVRACLHAWFDVTSIFEIHLKKEEERKDHIIVKSFRNGELFREYFNAEKKI